MSCYNVSEIFAAVSKTSTNKSHIYATDYDPRDSMTKMFFATVQNKLHYAVHENTAAEIIYNRVDNEKPFVGMTNFKGNYVTKDDMKIAKTYLSEIELQRLNLQRQLRDKRRCKNSKKLFVRD